MAGTRRPRRRCTSRRLHRFPNGGVRGRRLAVLGRPRHPPRGARRRRARSRAPARSTASASTRGPSTTACSTATATCSATRTATATPAPTACSEQVAAQDRPGRALRGHRPPAAAVQHALPAGRGARHGRARVGRDAAAAARPARLLADRRASAPSAPTPRPPSSTTSRAGAWSLDLAAPARPAVVDPAAAARGRRRGRPAAATRPAATSGCAAGVPGRRGRLARHGLGRGRRARAERRARSPTSPPAPGRWSASSSTAPVLTEEARAGRLHQRGRRRRHHPLPQERDGPVGALGVVRAWDGPACPAPTWPPCCAAAAAAARCAPSSTSTTRGCCPPATCRPASRPWRARPASRCRARRSRSPAASLDSLALAYRRHRPHGVRAGRRDVDVVHVVGGGSQNQLLCQLTADACGAARARRSRRGGRPRQRARAGPRPRRRPARPRRHAGPRAAHPRPARYEPATAGRRLRTERRVG